MQKTKLNKIKLSLLRLFIKLINISNINLLIFKQRKILYHSSLDIKNKNKIFGNDLFNDFGFANSIDKNQIINNNNHHIFWYSYSANHFIYQKLNYLKNKNIIIDIFEYGSGNSTISYSNYSNINIIAIENNYQYFKFVKKNIINRKNNMVIYENKEEKYINHIDQYKKKFDIIIIDGIKRNKSCLKAITRLKDNGIIIFDNMNRSGYNKSSKLLIDNNFKYLDFVGHKANSFRSSLTRIFYKTDNIFNI